MIDVGGRTVREFDSPQDVWAIVDAWAEREGYRCKEEGAGYRLFQRGLNLLAVPRNVLITWTGSSYRLEAWVFNPPINRFLTFGLLPEEMKIEKGGSMGSIARKQARADVNLLLSRLGVPPIE